MLGFILKRIGLGIITLWAIITITFLIMHNIPGDPFASEGKMTQSVYDNLMAHYNLDKPLGEQYLIYLDNVAHLDLGPSITSKTRTVNDYIGENFPVSAQLGIVTFIFALVIGILLGVVAALKRNQWPDTYVQSLLLSGFLYQVLSYLHYLLM
ncbi:ABC transporter permease [Cellulosilyticum ruminicola]|uniref:ABC transporter permease n=1 Tax=Cellulosilyticum ruminicola TaxID=425254 RepID=UPI000B2C85CC|nr:ABC transporter permease [Cellulosilyticum ruminicola]